MSRQKKKENAGRELRQPDQAEIEWAVRQIEDLPTHSDGLHLGRYDREKAGGGRITEIGVLESGAGLRPGISWGQVLGCQDLNVVVEREFVGVRAKAYSVRFTLTFVIDEGLDQLLGKHVAFQQECVIVFQAAQGFL